jgi:hypothetical protein
MFAAKTGTTEQQNGTSRRVLFAFPGWTQTTKPPSAPKVRKRLFLRAVFWTILQWTVLPRQARDKNIGTVETRMAFSYSA